MKVSNMFIERKTDQDGITLLVTLLLMGVLLGVSASLLSITLKQYQLSGMTLASEMAFQAASAGMECALLHDLPPSGESPFAVDGSGAPVPEETSVGCFGKTSADLESTNSTVVSGEEQRFRYSWGNPEVCTEISIYKFSEAVDADGDTQGPSVTVNGQPMRSQTPSENRCPEGSVCTVIQARGYNVACSLISSGGRVVEREYTHVY